MPEKSEDTAARIIYVVLGIFGGMIGLHDLYADKDYRAAIKLLLTVNGLLFLTRGGALALLVVAVWCVIDIINGIKEHHPRKHPVPVVYLCVLALVIAEAVIPPIIHTNAKARDVVDTDLAIPAEHRRK